MKFVKSSLPHFLMFSQLTQNFLSFSDLNNGKAIRKLYNKWHIAQSGLFAHFISGSKPRQKQQQCQKHVIPRINDFARNQFLLTRIGFKGTAGGFTHIRTKRRGG